MRGIESIRVVQSRPSSTAKLLLYGILLAICWSPRIRLGFLPGENVDIRVQDIILAIALGYLIVAPSAPTRPRWDLVWGRWLYAFICISVVSTLIHMMLGTPVSDLIRVAYLGRSVEMFLLAIAVCGLYLRAGINTTSAGRVLRFGVRANLLWIGYQYLTDQRVTLFGEVGELVGSYGPKLIGEPSAFGTGIFLTFAAALTVADHRAAVVRPPVTWLTMLAIIGAASLTQSRVNLIIILVLLILLTRRRLRGLISAPLASFLLLGGVAAYIAWGDGLVGRISFDGLTNGLQTRFGIWSALADYVGGWFIIGVGPGGLAAEGVPRDEAHNIIVRAWLDFGVIGAIALLMTLGLALRAALRATRPEQPDSLRWAAFLATVTLGGVLAAGIVQDSLTAVTSTHLVMATLGIFAAELAREQVGKDREGKEAATVLLGD